MGKTVNLQVKTRCVCETLMPPNVCFFSKGEEPHTKYKECSKYVVVSLRLKLLVQTDTQTGQKQYAPHLSMRGHKKLAILFLYIC